MAVKIRLARRGRKKLALFDIVVADARSPRDGRFIEKIGTYNPNTNPATINLNTERAFHWLMVGAQPTDTTKAILSYKGVLYHRHLQIGVVKGALTQDQADAKFQAWESSHKDRVTAKEAMLEARKQDAFKKRLEAEQQVRETRAAALAAKAAEANADATEASAEEATESVEAVDAAPAEEAAAE